MRRREIPIMDEDINWPSQIPHSFCTTVIIWFLIKTNPENIIDKIKKKKKTFEGLRV